MGPWGGKGGGNDGGPWGRPSGGGSGGQGGGGDNRGGGGQNPPPPDIDELIRKSQETFRRMFGAGGNGGNGGGGGFPQFDQQNGKKGLAFMLGAVALVWLASGIYFVKADEQGVVMRFGEYHRTTASGVNYRLPYPIESVLKPRVTAVNKVEVGFRSSGGLRTKNADGSIPEESLMLTGDENIVDVNFEVQWRILKASDFLFNVRNPEETVKAVSESAMREVVGKTPIATILAEGKLQVEQSAKKLIQETLSNYKAGVEIVSVNLLKADPPAQVIDAFRDVQTARADLETERNKAEAYRNDIIPRARGQAEQMLQEAEAYKQEVVARSKGEASRFAAIYNEYKLAKDATKKRMYLETMEEIMQGTSKLIVEEGASKGLTPYMPLDELRPRPPAAATSVEVKP